MNFTDCSISAKRKKFLLYSLTSRDRSDPRANVYEKNDKAPVGDEEVTRALRHLTRVIRRGATITQIAYWIRNHQKKFKGWPVTTRPLPPTILLLL